jgi:hypothetical protein
LKIRTKSTVHGFTLEGVLIKTVCSDYFRHTVTINNMDILSSQNMRREEGTMEFCSGLMRMRTPPSPPLEFNSRSWDVQTFFLTHTPRREKKH